nr:FkbM family methyltransferase [Stygiolobus azoricus]
MNGAEKVIALEPFPESYELGEYNIKINNLDHKIILLPYALSDYDGYTDFVISSENPNANTFNPSPYVEKLGIKFEQKIKVPTITLPSIIQKYNINKIFLLKMDCEGCEYNVLRNLPEDILNRIDNIILEYHNQIQDLPDILKRVGFTVEYDNKSTGLMKAYKNNNGLI